MYESEEIDNAIRSAAEWIDGRRLTASKYELYRKEVDGSIPSAQTVATRRGGFATARDEILDDGQELLDGSSSDSSWESSAGDEDSIESILDSTWETGDGSMGTRFVELVGVYRSFGMAFYEAVDFTLVEHSGVDVESVAEIRDVQPSRVQHDVREARKQLSEREEWFDSETNEVDDPSERLQQAIEDAGIK